MLRQSTSAPGGTHQWQGQSHGEIRRASRQPRRRDLRRSHFAFTKQTMKKSILNSALLAALLVARTTAHAAVTITVQTDQPGAVLNHGMWGIFFEDINLGADGGLYAELVKNRSFEFPDALMGWSKISSGAGAGQLSIQTDAPFNPANPHYLRIEPGTTDAFGVANEGFRGIGVKAGEKYDFSAQVRAKAGSPAIKVELVAADGKIL